MKKIVTVLVLVLCLMASAVSTTAFAAENTVASVNGSSTISGSYHHQAASPDNPIQVDGSAPAFTLQVTNNSRGYYKMYVTTPLGYEYVSNATKGDGTPVSMTLPRTTSPSGLYYVTIMQSSGTTAGQTHYWTVTATW